MKVYIATTLGNVALQNAMRDALMKEGHHTITLDWSEIGELHDRPDLWTTVAKAEIDAVRKADLLILILKGGRGAHIELGAALVFDKPVIIVGPEDQYDDGGWGYPCLFYHHPTVIERIFCDDTEAYPSLVSQTMREHPGVSFWGNTWYLYECYNDKCPDSGTLIDLRIPEEKDPPDIICPRCGTFLHYEELLEPRSQAHYPEVKVAAP